MPYWICWSKNIIARAPSFSAAANENYWLKFVKQTVSLRWLNGIQRTRKLTVCFTKTGLDHGPNGR
jgi:hypothetical protein